MPPNVPIMGKWLSIKCQYAVFIKLDFEMTTGELITHAPCGYAYADKMEED